MDIEFAANTTALAILLGRRPSPSAMRRHRDRRLRRLLRHAARNVAVYRELFAQHGIDPESIRGVEDLSRLPIVESSMLRSRPIAERAARGRARGYPMFTSGTSGAKLEFYQSRGQSRINSAQKLRSLADYGARRDDRLVLIQEGMRTGRRDPTAGWALAWRDCPRWIGVDEARDPAELLAFLRSTRATAITCYPSVLVQIIEAMAVDDGPPLRPRWVTTAGETLTARTRENIESAFATRVRDRYGATETGMIAWQCPVGAGYHLCDESCIVEIVQGNRVVGHGERGDVVVTNLFAAATPFIRYRIGDVAVAGEGPCACGYPHGWLASLHGRETDHFIDADGKVLHSERLVTAVQAQDAWVHRCQFVQKRRDLIVMRVELSHRGRMPEQEASFRERVRGVLGPQIEFRIEFVGPEVFAGEGKFRQTRSEIRSTEGLSARRTGREIT